MLLAQFPARLGREHREPIRAAAQRAGRMVFAALAAADTLEFGGFYPFPEQLQKIKHVILPSSRLFQNNPEW